jgi:hypothetical protein
MHREEKPQIAQISQMQTRPLLDLCNLCNLWFRLPSPCLSVSVVS